MNVRRLCFLSSLSNQVEGDVKEEILQPPEPHPVPPILTPSPPSAFPTVTNVRQDNDRYHPKPILHVLESDQNPDLNENYNNKPAQDVPAPPAEDRRLERKLSIEIKKVPLQEGPRSFEGNSVLQRSHAFKRSNTSSSSMSEESDDPPRPNHLPLKAEKGHAAWSVSSPDRAASPPERSPSPAAPPRAALSFTNPLHSDFPDDSRSGISTATSTVTAAQQSDRVPRRVTPMSIAGQSLPTHTSSGMFLCFLTHSAHPSASFPSSHFLPVT